MGHLLEINPINKNLDVQNEHIVCPGESDFCFTEGFLTR